jgi:hypothetical protein
MAFDLFSFYIGLYFGATVTALAGFILFLLLRRRVSLWYKRYRGKAFEEEGR